jgi:predicted MFS family arabinose efflux permease
VVRLANLARPAALPVWRGLCAVAAGTATFWAMPGLAELAAVILVSGLGCSPGFSPIEQQAPPGRVTEGMAMLTSAISVGTAAGSAAVGWIVDAGGVRGGHAFAATCAAAAVLACLLGLTRLAVPGATLSGAART